MLALAGCAHNSPYEPADPLEKINRPIYAFNMVADQYVLRPVAVTYVNYAPPPLRIGVSNFFDNLFYPAVIINDALQAKFKQSGRSEEHTSELQSLMRNSYAVFCLKKKKEYYTEKHQRRYR